MGKAWDSTGITFQSETWRILAKVLHPGAFLMVFAGSRGWHRLAVALEDASLILQPSIFVWGLGVVEVPLMYGWLQAQAFPKASRIDTKLDEQAKAEREVLGPGKWHSPGRKAGWGTNEIYGKQGTNVVGDGKIDTAPATPLARAWEGHRYGGQVLKDALTPIIVAQKPWEGKRLDCIVRTGAGSLNVDAGRINSAVLDSERRISVPAPGIWGHGKKHPQKEGEQRHNPQGRWPSNFALVHKAPGPDGEGGCVRAGTRRVFEPKEKRKTPIRTNRGNEADGCEHVAFGRYEESHTTGYADPDGMETVDAWRCEEGCVCEKLGEQSGERKTTYISPHHQNRRNGEFLGQLGHPQQQGFDDKGTAARFYHQAGWEHERAEMQCAEGCPVAKLDEQAGERESRPGKTKVSGTAVHGIGLGSGHQSNSFYPGDSGGASRFYAQADWTAEIAERLATGDPVRYCPKAAKKERNQGLDDFYWRKDKQSPTGFVRISREEWEALGEEEERVKAETGKRVSLRARGNIHTTVKPISLLIWICHLLSPPEEYAPRRIVIPFLGSGSEMVGVILSRGFEEVVGIELLEDYCDIAKARAAWWSAILEETGETDPKELMKKRRTGQKKLL